METQTQPISQVFLEDCMQVMARYPDGYFDLACVDPPYGINASEMTMGSGKNKKYFKGKKWDKETPKEQYFSELFRISKNQIIWGANYFSDKLPISRSWLFWDKLLNKEVSFGDGELAWTSFNRVIKKIPIQYSGFLGADKFRIHPTQKPEKLYDWIFKNYATEGMKILDTHLGSGSSRIAAHKAKMNFVGCEIDAEYFLASEKRYNEFKAQLTIF